jgi:hypothetical protein
MQAVVAGIIAQRHLETADKSKEMGHPELPTSSVQQPAPHYSSGRDVLPTRV